MREVYDVFHSFVKRCLPPPPIPIRRALSLVSSFVFAIFFSWVMLMDPNIMIRNVAVLRIARSWNFFISMHIV